MQCLVPKTDLHSTTTVLTTVYSVQCI